VLDVKTRPPYSVSSKGRLIGHTDLGAADPTMGVRMGDLHTTEAYLDIAPLIWKLSKLTSEHGMARRDSPEWQSLALLRSEYEQLDIQIKDVGGVLIEPVSVEITDFEELCTGAADGHPLIQVFTFDGLIYARLFEED